ncbi:MAG: carboxypeptidase M32, partial [Patescibacteria group bacterium]
MVEISHLTSILNLLEWDQEVNMPRKAGDARAEAFAHLAGIIHGKVLALNDEGHLRQLKKLLDEGKISGGNAVIVTETWRTYDREIKLPASFVQELATTISKAQGVWVQAREQNDFSIFLPYLEKIIKLKKQEAELVGYTTSPYDALLDAYEPGIDTTTASTILLGLKEFLVPFLKQIAESKVKIESKRVKGRFKLHQQILFNELVLKKIGFDLEAGRLDASVHPFSSGFHPYDVRLTTRYKENNVLYSLGSTIHEAGHGLYEQGLPVEHFGTPLAETVSLGIHESQSRLWENHIGKGRSFWKYFYPKLQRAWPKPFQNISSAEFYQIINRVQPSLIRTEADEVTYNLHIIMRFELERDLIEGKIKAKDLPAMWRAKMKEYLDIEVPSDTLGVLQDLHWSAVLFGYFPTYSFGNLYAAQFYAKMEKDLPDLDRKIAGGDFTAVIEWLRRHIHMTGKTDTASDLVKKVTGEALDP